MKKNQTPPNTSIKRPLKINEGTEIETTINTQKSTQSNIKIQKRPQTATINSNKIYNSLTKSTKNPKIDFRQDLEKYLSNIEFNDMGCEPYITPYTPKMVKIINKNDLIERKAIFYYNNRDKYDDEYKKDLKEVKKTNKLFIMKIVMMNIKMIKEKERVI